ncbi:MAG: T9SS type A sorting domain-containing protein [bacterium]
MKILTHIFLVFISGCVFAQQQNLIFNGDENPYLVNQQLFEKIEDSTFYKPSIVILDNTKTIQYTYDSAGKLVEEVLNEANLLKSHTKYYYEFNKLVTKEIDSLISNEYVTCERYSYLYNENGLLISAQVEKRANNVLTNNSLSTFNYDENNNLLEKTIMTWINNIWEMKSQYHYLYNTNNLLIDYTTAVWSNNQWNNHGRIFYNYSGILVTTKTYSSWSNNGWNITSRINYSYNNQGLLSSSYNSICNNGVWASGDGTFGYSYDVRWNLLYVVKRTDISYHYNLEVERYAYTYDDYNNRISALHTRTTYGVMFFPFTVNYPTNMSILFNNNTESIDFYAATIEVQYSAITEVGEELNTLNSFILNQNYPNPFNPSTTFSFSLPEKEFVTLKIYDVLGKEITTLVNEELNAGSYKNDWNAANLSSGIYFYRLQAGKFSETKKLMLVK